MINLRASSFRDNDTSFDAVKPGDARRQAAPPTPPPVQASPRRIAQNALPLAQAADAHDRAFLAKQGFRPAQIERVFRQGGKAAAHFLCEEDNLHNLRRTFSTQHVVSIASRKGARQTLAFLCQPGKLNKFFSLEEIVCMASNDEARPVLELLCEQDKLRHSVKSMDEDQLGALVPLLNRHQQWTLRHLQGIRSMNGSQLEALPPLLDRHQEWTTVHLQELKSMDCDPEALIRLLDVDKNWVTDHLKNLQLMDDAQLTMLAALLDRHQEWTNGHFHDLESMCGEQLEVLVPLLDRWAEWTIRHFQDVKSLRGDQWAALPGLLDGHEEWTSQHLENIKLMGGDQLEALPVLLSGHEDWATRHLDNIKSMFADQLNALPALLDRHSTWAAAHLDKVKSMYGDQLKALPMLLDDHQDWTTIHFLDLRSLGSYQLEALPRLLDGHKDWTSAHLPEIKRMRYHLSSLANLLDIAPAWTKRHVRSLIAIPENILKDLSVFFLADVHSAEKLNEQDLTEFAEKKGGDLAYFFGKMEAGRREFATAANPLLREQLGVKHGSPAALLAHGASRSTLDRAGLFGSALIQAFEKNRAHLPEATFGVEIEQFLPGLKPGQYAELNTILNSPDYRYVDDGSLIPTGSIDDSFEANSTVLNSVADLQNLQNILARLNDMGAYSNASSGVHIHVGIEQWEATRLLSGRASVPSHLSLAAWDAVDDEGITPFQLRLMKQFFINMHSIQKDFYLVSRNSKFSQPNEPAGADKSIDRFYRDITATADVTGLIRLVQPGGRHHNVNLEAFFLHKTIEIRGFTKKNSDFMGVDPNLPIRDIILLQEVLIATLADARDYLLSGASALPEAPTIQPAKGLQAIADRYTQDTFAIEIVHALLQRESGKRMLTMGMIVKDRAHIHPDTLIRVRENCPSLLTGDEQARQFLGDLERKGNGPQFPRESTSRQVRPMSPRSAVNRQLLG